MKKYCNMNFWYILMFPNLSFTGQLTTKRRFFWHWWIKKLQLTSEAATHTQNKHVWQSNNLGRSLFFHKITFNFQQNLSDFKECREDCIIIAYERIGRFGRIKVDFFFSSPSELWQCPCWDQYSAQPACSSRCGQDSPALSGSCRMVLLRLRTVALQGSAQPDHPVHSLTTQDTAEEETKRQHRFPLIVVLEIKVSTWISGSRSISYQKDIWLEGISGGRSHKVISGDQTCGLLLQHLKCSFYKIMW